MKKVNFKKDIKEAMKETSVELSELFELNYMYEYKGYKGANAISLWLNDYKGYSLADNYHANETWKQMI